MKGYYRERRGAYQESWLVEEDPDYDDHAEELLKDGYIAIHGR